MNNEIFKTITGFNNYKISNLGNVKNLLTNKMLKSAVNVYGYLFVSLYNNGKTQQKRIHRLLGETFIENPLNKPFIDHIDHNRLNNNINNLRWADEKENSRNSTKRKNSSSKYRGVYYDNEKKRYRVKIYVNNRQEQIGYFNDENEAGEAYNKFARDIYKDFACLNIIT